MRGLTLDRQVVVAEADHEPDGDPRSEVEPELLDPGGAGEPGPVGQGECRGQHAVVVAHWVSGLAPDPRMKADETTNEHSARKAHLPGLLDGERPVQQLRRDLLHAS